MAQTNLFQQENFVNLKRWQGKSFSIETDKQIRAIIDDKYLQMQEAKVQVQPGVIPVMAPPKI